MTQSFHCPNYGTPLDYHGGSSPAIRCAFCQTAVIVPAEMRRPSASADVLSPAGQPVTNFNLTSNRQYTDPSGQVVKETSWFRVSAWGKNAENCNEYLRKGSLVLVEGGLVCDPDAGGPRLYTRRDG